MTFINAELVRLRDELDETDDPSEINIIEAAIVRLVEAEISHAKTLLRGWGR